MDDNELIAKISRNVVIENSCTLIVIAVITIGVSVFTKDASGLWSLFLLLNMSSMPGIKK